MTFPHRGLKTEQGQCSKNQVSGVEGKEQASRREGIRGKGLWKEQLFIIYSPSLLNQAPACWNSHWATIKI